MQPKLHISEQEARAVVTVARWMLTVQPTYTHRVGACARSLPSWRSFEHRELPFDPARPRRPDHGGRIQRLDTGPSSVFLQWASTQVRPRGQPDSSLSLTSRQGNPPQDVHRWRMAPPRVGCDHHRPGRPAADHTSADWRDHELPTAQPRSCADYDPSEPRVAHSAAEPQTNSRALRAGARSRHF
jgi:hypothetical protein